MHEKLVTLDAELAILRERQASANLSLSNERKDAQKLQGLVENDSQAIANELAAVLAADPWPSPVETLCRLQSIYTQLAAEYTRQHALLNEQASTLREEASKLEDEIRKLRTGDREVS